MRTDDTLEVAVRSDLGGFGLDVTHEFRLRGITALFGPSGSGKSTLLRAIAGLERMAVGRVALGRETWLDSEAGLCVPPHLRGVGYVFQDARLFGHLSVRGNLRFAQKRARGPGPAFDDVTDALGIGPLLDRRTGALSGGERQRVAIARTLLSRPRLLMLDEPLAALDLRRKAAILPYIAALPDRFGIPTIYVTHALDEVTQLADRIVALRNGRVVASGGVGEVLERLDIEPLAGRFEAGVALDVVVTGHDAAFHLTVLEHRGQRLIMPGLELPVGAHVRLRIRARDVSIALVRPEGISIRNMLDGTVSAIAAEPDTAFAEVLVDIGGAQIRARLTRLAVADLGLKPGAPVVALVKSVAFDRRAIAPARAAAPVQAG